MNPHFVSDGKWRLRSNPEFQARLETLRESIRERHAGELAKAGFLERMILPLRIAVEYRCERRKIMPSQYSLYSSNNKAG